MSEYPVPFLTLVRDEDGTVRAPIQAEVEELAIMTTGSHQTIHQRPTRWAGLTFIPLEEHPYGWKVVW